MNEAFQETKWNALKKICIKKAFFIAPREREKE